MILIDKRFCAILLILALILVCAGRVSAQGRVRLDDRDDYARKAKEHFQKERWAEGKKVIDEGLKQYPKDSDLHMLLGRFYLEHKNYDSARFELMKSLEYNKNNVGAKQILVNVEVETKRYSSAICYINELLEVNPYWKGLWRKKIDVYRLQGNDVEANRLLKRISQVYPDDINIKEAYLHYIEQEALSKKKEGKMSDAITLSADLIEKDPTNANFYIEQINNYLKAGDHQKALVNAERGLYNLPKNISLINKKIDILAGMHRYEEVLSFIQLKISEGCDRAVLNKRYNYFMEEAARNGRKYDTYTLYKNLFDQNPGNDEAFNYVLSTAISKALYDDALEAVKRVKNLRGEQKDLLAKEQLVYERMGEQSKANQIKARLFQLYPNDEDVRYKYTLYRMQQAKDDMAGGLYEKALNHWKFIAEYGDEEQKKTALMSIHNCCCQLGLFNEALITLNRLVKDYPDEPEWSIKRADIYGKQKKYMKALEEYERVIRLTSQEDMERVMAGYEELATVCTKQLIEGYFLKDALQIVDHWLTVNPKSEAGTRYAINISAQMKDYARMRDYALFGLKHKPEDIFYNQKLAEAYNYQKEYKQSLDILTPQVEENPYHLGLISAYSQSNEDYARQLIKDMKYDESLTVLNNALAYDPSNKSLKYWKGVTYEKLNQNDSAYYYQSFYEPSLLEVGSFKGHLNYLKNKRYKNKISLDYLRSRFGDVDQITSIATLEYFYFGTKDSYAGRVNYTGRDTGKGIQGQVEWTRKWKPDISTRADIAVGSKYFSKIAANASVYKLFKYDWEAELGAGYKRMDNDDDLINVVAGISKTIEPWWLNTRFNSIVLNSKWYYNLSAQARFYLNNPRNYLLAMGSIGSAPDVDIIDNQLYNGFSVTNSMVGLGVHHLINDILSVGLLGSWYNYEDNDGDYRNLYNLYFQFHVSF